MCMDDFGSGYLSLNVLKDYELDELKLDMGFLSSFTGKSRDIITLIVQMAKRIGMETLAEGVETAEQFAFLREIGCEKVQGYYFGEARTYEETMARLAERGISAEPMRMISYYDAASRVDLVRHRPLALVEDDGISFHHLFANSFYMGTLRELGIERLEEAETWMNVSGSPLRLQYRAFAETVRRSQRQPKAAKGRRN